MYLRCDSFNGVKAALDQNNLQPTVAEITYLPKVSVDPDTDTGQKVLRLMENLDEHDDVQNVYTNVNFTEAMVAAAAKE